jgi:hypothetical protein
VRKDKLGREKEKLCREEEERSCVVKKRREAV